MINIPGFYCFHANFHHFWLGATLWCASQILWPLHFPCTCFGMNVIVRKILWNFFAAEVILLFEAQEMRSFWDFIWLYSWILHAYAIMTILEVKVSCICFIGSFFLFLGDFAANLWWALTEFSKKESFQWFFLVLLCEKVFFSTSLL